MIKNKTRLVAKLFILTWVLLILQIVLKLTFNWYKPYVIPNHQLEKLGNFIDTTKWLKIILNGLFYLVNSIILALCGLQQWKFKNKIQRITFYPSVFICYALNIVFPDNYFTIFLLLLVVISLNYKKTLYIIASFVISFLFLLLSTWLEGFINADDVNYILGTLLNNDYYIMLILNYILFNFIRMKREGKKMGDRFVFHWFGKTSTELKEILETNKNLSEIEKIELKKAIEAKENEENNNKA